MPRSLLLTETVILRGIACELPAPVVLSTECIMIAPQVLWIKKVSHTKMELVLGPVCHSPAGDLVKSLNSSELHEVREFVLVSPVSLANRTAPSTSPRTAIIAEFMNK